MATKRWIGDAIPVKQVDTITIANVWATADTITVTCNSKDMILTVGAAVTTDDVAAALNAAFNSGAYDGGLLGSESRNIGGKEIPEFRDFVSTVAGSVVTLKSAIAGKPFTISISETTAGSGTATHSAEDTAATGPNHVSNVDNWDGGLPGAGDTARWDQGRIDTLYDLDYFRTNTIDCLFVRTTDYEGTIGLPEFNVGGYHEYRDRYLELYDAATISDIRFVDGEFRGSGGSTYLDCDGQTVATMTIDNACRTGGSDVVEITGGTYNGIQVGRANVIIEPQWGVAAASATTSYLFIGGKDIPDRETRVVIPTVGVLPVGFSLYHFGGELICYDNLGVINDVQYIYDGKVSLRGDGTGGGGTIKVIGGTLSVEVTGGITKIECWSAGTVEFGESSTAPAVTLDVYGGGHINKAGKPGISHALIGCTENDVFIIE